jgi:hypothetical protein
MEMKSITEILASSTFWAAVGSIAAAMGSIAAVAQIWRSRARRRGQARSSLKRIVVRRVTNYASEEAKQAVDLLNGDPRIGVDERCDAGDLLRWVRESSEMSMLARLRFQDTLWVAIDGDEVVSAAFLTHYRQRRIAFLSYLVTRTPKNSRGKGRWRQQGHDTATIQLAEAMRQHLRKQPVPCQYMLTEVDDPRVTASPVSVKLRCARIQLFDQLAHLVGTCFRVLIDAPYAQPVLDSGADGNAPAMLLGIIDLQRRHDHVVSRRQAIEMLRFVYDAVYGDSYLTQGEADREYRAYVARLRQEAESGISRDVRAPCGRDFADEVREVVLPRVSTRAVEAASPL